MIIGPRLNAALEVDSGPCVGVGHLIRSLTLAEALVTCGWTISLRSAPCVPPWLKEWAGQFPIAEDTIGVGPRPTVLLVDSYRADVALLRQIRLEGTLIVSFADGDALDYEADLFIDQNFGASAPLEHTPSSTWLTGEAYAIVRPHIVAARPQVAPAAAEGVPRILCVFGGTDPAGVGLYAVKAMSELGGDFQAMIISDDPAVHSTVAAFNATGTHKFDAMPGTLHLAPLIQSSDIVVCASGTILWELMTLGKAVAVTTTNPNQEPIIERLAAAQLIASLGRAGDWSANGCRLLFEWIVDSGSRAVYAQRAWDSIDGRGAERLAGAITQWVLESHS